MTTSSLQESYLRLMPNEHLGTSWFQRLREYLSRFEQLNLELVLSIISTTVSLYFHFHFIWLMFIFVTLIVSFVDYQEYIHSGRTE